MRLKKWWCIISYNKKFSSSSQDFLVEQLSSDLWMGSYTVLLTFSSWSQEGCCSSKQSHPHRRRSKGKNEKGHLLCFIFWQDEKPSHKPQLSFHYVSLARIESPLNQWLAKNGTDNTGLNQLQFIPGDEPIFPEPILSISFKYWDSFSKANERDSSWVGS